MNVNKVILVGRLTRDPEVRTTQGGRTVTSVSLATTFTWKDASGQKQERPEYHSIILWGKIGEIAGQYLTKGQEAYFEGRLQTRKYTGKDGVERRVTEIVADNMQLGSRPQGAPRPAGSYQPKDAPAASQAKEAPAEEIPTINLDDEEEVRIEDVPF